MILKKRWIVAASLACLLTPLSVSAQRLEAAGPPPASEPVAGQARLTDGFAAHWLVLAAIALGLIIFFAVDDNGEEPVSP